MCPLLCQANDKCASNGYACLAGSHCVECEDGSGLHCCNPQQSSTVHIARISSLPSALLSSIEAKLSRSASGSVAPAGASSTALTRSASSSGLSSVPPSAGASSSFTPLSASMSGVPKRFYTTFTYTYRLNSSLITTATELVITADGPDAAQSSFSVLEASIDQQASSLQASVSVAVHSTPASSLVGPTSATSSASVSPNGVSGPSSRSDIGGMWLLVPAGLIAGFLAIAL